MHDFAIDRGETEAIFLAHVSGSAIVATDALETQMILNHKAAIELLVNKADLVDFSPYTIFSLHALLSDGLLADSSACGRIRHHPASWGAIWQEGS